MLKVQFGICGLFGISSHTHHKDDSSALSKIKTPPPTSALPISMLLSQYVSLYFPVIREFPCAKLDAVGNGMRTSNCKQIK